MALIVLSVGLLIFAGHFLTGFFQRTKVPDVLILMLAGIVIGPVLHLVSPGDFGKVGPVFTTLALIIILFEGGIHLGIRDLGAAARDSLLLTMTTFVVTALAITYLVDLLLPVEPLSALLIGTILAGTSSAVVVPLLRILRMGQGPSASLFLESALTDVLTVVLSLALIRALTPGEVVTAGAAAADIARSFLLAAGIGLVGAFLWSAILPKIRQFPNTVFTTIAYVLILYGITELWGYSGAIAALTFGVAVANLPLIPERVLGKVISFRLVGFQEVERTFFAEAVFIVKTFFFVYLGISMRFDDWRTFAVGGVATLGAFIGRAIMVRLTAPKAWRQREALLATALIPKGLAAAVLASIPAQQGLPQGDLIQSTVYAVVFSSIVACALFVFAAEAGKLDRYQAWALRPFTPGPVPQMAASTDLSLIHLPDLPEDDPIEDEPHPVALEPYAPSATPDHVESSHQFPGD